MRGLHIWYRVYQRGMFLAMNALRWPQPRVHRALEDIPAVLAREGRERPLIITDAGIVRAGLLARLTGALGDMPHAVYDGTVANPTIDNIEAARALYLAEGCDCLIALGGGSPMDCAKAVGARLARPRMPVARMRGQLRVRRRIVPLVAVPTTAGTGSETTLAAVVLDARTHEKYAINDLALIPRHAVLDASLTVGLPPPLTAQTGMDALTHAVEAFIGRSNTGKTRGDSIDAVFLIHRYLLRAYRDGADIEAREGMQRAAFLAGAAFTRAFVGYVHALAHQLGALYGTPHGLANAILLPHVLAFYGEAAHPALAELYEPFGGMEQGLGQAGKAAFVLARVRSLGREMGIPERLQGVRGEDVARIVQGALEEANPLYPVPVILDAAGMEKLLRSAML